MKPEARIRSRIFAAIGLATAGLSSLACAFRPAQSVGGANEITAYQPYQDDVAGFGFARPAGWTVRTDDGTIFVESPDRSEYLIVQAFDATPGETSRQHLQALSHEFSGLFAQLTIGNITEIPAKGSEAIGALHYQGPAGPAQVRALCSIIGGKSLLYIVTAPEVRFDAELPKLLRVASSVAFTRPTIHKDTGKGGPAKETFVDYVIDRRLYPLTRKTSRPSNGAFYTTSNFGNQPAFRPGIDFGPITR